MGEREDALTSTSPTAHEERIGAVRDELSATVDELKRRARDVTNVRLQVARHPAVFVGVGVALAGLLLAAIIVRRRNRVTRMDRLIDAMSVLRRHPERLAQPTPSVSRKVAASALTAVATTAARRWATRAVDRVDRGV